MRFKSHNGDSRRFMQIAASVLLLCFGSLIFSSFDQSSSHASTSTPRTRNLQTYINDASTSTPGTRNLQTYIDDEVSAADWPPSSIVDKVVDERNRVAIVAVNCAGLRFADNWANSLLTLGIKNFIMIPLDNSTEAMLNEIYPENTVPMLPGANDGLEKYPIYSDFGGYAFKELTSTRPLGGRAAMGGVPCGGSLGDGGLPHVDDEHDTLVGAVVPHLSVAAPTHVSMLRSRSVAISYASLFSLAIEWTRGVGVQDLMHPSL